MTFIMVLIALFSRMTIAKLSKRWFQRMRSRKRQKRLFLRTRKLGHRKAYRRHGLAMRKLRSLMKKVREMERIDWNGCEPLPLSRRRARKAAKFILNRVDGLYISSTVRYDSVTYHGPSQRRAIDFGSNDPSERPEREAQKLLLKKFGPGYFLELFGPDNDGWVKNGQVYTASEGEFLETLHDDHSHMAA